MESLSAHVNKLPTYEEATTKTDTLPTYKEATTNTNLTTRPSHSQPTHGIGNQQYIEDQTNANFTTIHDNQVNNNVDIVIIVIILATVTILVYFMFKSFS